MTSTQGGKREGAGRPKGAVSIPHGLRLAAREHTETAIKALVDVAGDAEHPNRIKAAELLLDRAWGKAGAESPAEGIIGRFMGGEISAVQAGLELEANGMQVGNLLLRYINNQIDIATYRPDAEIFGKPEPLPRE